MFSLGVESKRLSKLSKELSVAVTFRTEATSTCRLPVSPFRYFTLISCLA